MIFHGFLGRRESLQGPIIGGVRDKSALTDGRNSLLNSIIGTYVWPGWFVYVHI